ncbi:MAG: hypothetical protein ABEI99_11155, partial [Halobaculum sp.]
VVIRARETAVGRATASLLVPGTAVLAVFGLVLSISDAVFVRPVPNQTVLIARVVEYVGVSFAVGAATAGVIGTLRDGIGDGAVTQLWKTTVGTATPIVLWLVIAFGIQQQAGIAALTGIDVGSVVRPILRPSDPLVGLVTLWLLVLTLLETARRALRAAPVVELAPRSTREAVADRVDRITATMFTGLKVATLVPIVVGSAVTAGVFTEAFTLPRSVDALLAASTNGGVRTPIVFGIVVFTAFTLAVWVLRRLTGSAAGVLASVGPSVLGGFVTIGVVTLTSPFVWTALDAVPPGQREPLRELLTRHTPTVVVLGGITVALFALAALLATVVIGAVLGLIPTRASGGAIAAGSLAAGALAVGFSGDRPAVVFGVVALSIVAWDASERGVVTRTELGSTPPLSIEVVQTVGTTAVTGAGVALAWTLYTVVLPRIEPPNVTIIGVLAAIAATLLLLFTVRG